MLSASINFRSVVFSTALAAFAVGQTMASPTNPLQSFHQATGSVAVANPINPLPPFPPGTGLVAVANPINPLPPFPPGTGSIAIL